jgi:hypothetical protein
MRFEAVYFPFADTVYRLPARCRLFARTAIAVGIVHVVHAAALAAGFMRSIIRVFRRGKGF